MVNLKNTSSSHLAASSFVVFNSPVLPSTRPLQTYRRPYSSAMRDAGNKSSPINKDPVTFLAGLENKNIVLLDRLATLGKILLSLPEGEKKLNCLIESLSFSNSFADNISVK